MLCTGVPDSLPYRLPYRLPDSMSDGLPHGLSDRLPDGMSHSLPDGLLRLVAYGPEPFGAPRKNYSPGGPRRGPTPDCFPPWEFPRV
jgi:hypothetical protein